MPDYVDLEIGLHRRQEHVYAVEMRVSLPDDDTDKCSDEAQAEFNLEALRADALDPAAYGQRLSASLFAEAAAQSAFERARDLANNHTPRLDLRVRLHVSPSATELHQLHWETLCQPGQAAPLATSESILFSRYLSSPDWEPVRPRSKNDLRALVVVANPPNLGTYGLAPIDVAAELERARTSLGPNLQVATLPDAGGNGQPARRATLNELTACLRHEPYDILYLVCHGALKDGKPWLWLEDDTGPGEPHTSGQALLNCLRDLNQRPRLVVLASCESAGAGTGQSLLALGPRLAEAGVPAVLAMQGNVSMATVAQFMPRFFEELQHDGQIDHALAVARGAVRGRDDWWMPVLFMRLKSGQIWYVPGFGAGGKEDFESWQPLKNAIEEKRCTPILGPGLTEPWLGQQNVIARHWAETYHYPLAPSDREELPRIAQYLSRHMGSEELIREYRLALREGLLQQYKEILPEELITAKFWKPADLLKALKIAAERRWESARADAYCQLADLRLPIYITTTPDDLLTQALVRRGAKPEVRLCPWWLSRHTDALDAKCLYDDEPTEERPLVYHLFGKLDTPDSLVLSEDNFFDFLIGYTREKKYVPTIILDVLTSTNLLFLGWRTDDWGYRVLFRTLMAQEGSAQLGKKRHVSAQVEPEEGRLLDTKRARHYLEEIFTKDNIDIYWGRSEDFLSALTQQLQAA